MAVGGGGETNVSTDLVRMDDFRAYCRARRVERWNKKSGERSMASSGVRTRRVDAAERLGKGVVSRTKVMCA